MPDLGGRNERIATSGDATRLKLDGGGSVSVSSTLPPVAGQVLTATSADDADWLDLPAPPPSGSFTNVVTALITPTDITGASFTTGYDITWTANGTATVNVGGQLVGFNWTPPIGLYFVRFIVNMTQLDTGRRCEAFMYRTTAPAKYERHLGTYETDTSTEIATIANSFIWNETVGTNSYAFRLISTDGSVTILADPSTTSGPFYTGLEVYKFG